MYKEIQIGERSLALKATASTTYRFKQVFKRDILKVMMDTQDKYEQEEDDIMKLAYIMAMAAESQDMGKLNEDTYIAWLDGFDPMDLFSAGEDIMSVFQKNRESTEEQKKTASDRAGDIDGAVSTPGNTAGAADQ